MFLHFPPYPTPWSFTFSPKLVSGFCWLGVSWEMSPLAFVCFPHALGAYSRSQLVAGLCPKSECLEQATGLLAITSNFTPIYSFNNILLKALSSLKSFQ